MLKDIGSRLLNKRLFVVSQVILWPTMSIVYSGSFLTYVFYSFFIVSVVFLYLGLDSLSKK